MISIIIPTLNEEQYLRRTILHTLAKASNSNNLEIIVVDAGSKDRTLESVRDLNIKTFEKPEFVLKRYKSLNFGVSQSAHEVVLFLDADTLLPNKFDALIERKIGRSEIVGGAFEFAFEELDWKLRIITLLNRVRYRFGKVYGDQAVFVKKQFLDRVCGVPEEPLMETAYLCKALRRIGKLIIIRPALKTSPRRFRMRGFFKVAWFDINMFIRFNLGFPVSNYAEKYWSKNLKNK